MQQRGSHPSPQLLLYTGLATSHAHPGQAARQGAGCVPTARSEAKRWALSSWQRKRQLAQEGKSQGADCWGRVPRGVSNAWLLAAFLSCLAGSGKGPLLLHWPYHLNYCNWRLIFQGHLSLVPSQACGWLRSRPGGGQKSGRA